MVTLYNQENSEINFDVNKDYFSKPFIIFDVLKEDKTPEIANYDSKEAVEQLYEKGISILAEEVDKKKLWAHRQKYILHLQPSNLPVDEKFKRLKELPANHYIQIDSNNHRCRLYGDFISPQNKFTQWVNF